MLPYALHSPTLLAELGLNVKVLLEGEGISRRGTKDNTPFNGDVIRKMLDDMTPLEENPLEENPLEENPLEENPLEENPLEENPLEENPLEENPYLKPGDMVIEDNRGQRIS